jgi:twitching motility protein PilT
MSQPLLVDLIKRAIGAGALEVKLVPGRRVVVVLPQGASEVRGDAMTPERIQQLVTQVMPPPVQRSFASGWAEWEFELERQGVVRACAELKLGLPHVTLFLEGCSSQPEFAEALPFPTAPYGGQPTIPRMSVGAKVDIPLMPPEPVLAPSVAQPVLATSAAKPVLAPSVTQPTLQTAPPLSAAEQIYGDASGAGTTMEIDRLLLHMLDRKASDLHLSSGVCPMLRVDGEMEPIAGAPIMTPEQVQRILMPIIPPRNRQEFSDHHDSDFAYELPGKARFRGNVFVDLYGMGAVFRVIPSKILTVEDLKLPQELLTLCELPKGLVLVTGPTGSGKSTTLAALIDYVNRTRSAHIITIEDPIEFVHPNKKCLINQRQVGEHTDSFKKALRAALREDPDIVLLGEMRDLETIAIALETAETGHLVFGTLHTSSAPATIDRIIDQYPPEQQNQIRVMLSNSLKGVICQMLCKKVGGGRVAALEVMLSVPAIANLIRESKVYQIPTVMQTGRKIGMCMMNDNLVRLVRDGQVSPEEAMSKSNDKSGLLLSFQQNNITYTPAPVT